jgi:hypothetical protein
MIGCLKLNIKKVTLKIFSSVGSWSDDSDVLLRHAVTSPNMILENYHHGAIDIISVTLFKNVWVFVQIINKMVLTWDLWVCSFLRFQVRFSLMPIWVGWFSFFKSIVPNILKRQWLIFSFLGLFGFILWKESGRKNNYGN